MGRTRETGRDRRSSPRHWPISRDRLGAQMPAPRARSRGIAYASVQNLQEVATHCRNVTVRRGPSAGASNVLGFNLAGLAEPGRAEVPPPTWCQEARVPSSMIIDDECARCH
jgi:hypothetical protein